MFAHGVHLLQILLYPSDGIASQQASHLQNHYCQLKEKENEDIEQPDVHLKSKVFIQIGEKLQIHAMR